jgi:hypothetical protein
MGLGNSEGAKSEIRKKSEGRRSKNYPAHKFTQQRIPSTRPAPACHLGTASTNPQNANHRQP